MTVGDENQMIDQIDTDCPQKPRGVARRGHVCVARPGDARRVVVRHHDGRSASAQQRAPASRRDDAASRRFAVDAFQTDQALIRIEASKEQAFPIAVELGTQQLPRNRIFALALHKAPAPGIGRGFAHRVKDCHPRRMAQVRRGPNSRLPRIGWIGGGGRGDALAAVQCGA